MLEKLKQEVLEANLLLPEYKLVAFTWGNVSGIDRERGLVVIKPSGVEYANMTTADMVVVDLDCNVVEGKLNPSSDTPTHVELYKAFSELGGVVHTHSTYATSWAQSGLSIPCYGTTHADYFYGEIPCVKVLTKAQVETDYEKNTGLAIVNHLTKKKINPLHTPAVLCAHHGVFTYGKTPFDAVHSAVVAEEVARMAMYTRLIQLDIGLTTTAPNHLQDKHFFRKHGENAYYGQKKED